MGRNIVITTNSNIISANSENITTKFVEPSARWDMGAITYEGIITDAPSCIVATSPPAVPPSFVPIEGSCTGIAVITGETPLQQKPVMNIKINVTATLSVTRHANITPKTATIPAAMK